MDIDAELDLEPELTLDEELPDMDLDSDLELGSEESELNSFEEDLDIIDNLDDMDLSPEVIEASTDINDLPDMDMELEVIDSSSPASNSSFKTRDELSPDISALLEKASIIEEDLSIAVVSVEESNIESSYDFIKEHFDDTENIYDLGDGKIAVALNGIDGDNALKEVNELISRGKENNLNLKVGISSMNGRQVGENRLLGEAISAVDRTEEMDKDMLAFKPDPDKYKDYIKNS